MNFVPRRNVMTKNLAPIAGPAAPDAKHLQARHILEWFGVRIRTFKVWKSTYNFPRPTFIDGHAYYERKAVEAWRNSDDAPMWVRGLAPKPTGMSDDAAALRPARKARPYALATA
jgi:hypothetical protein